MSTSRFVDSDIDGLRRLAESFKDLLHIADCFRPEGINLIEFARYFDLATRFRGTTYGEFVEYVSEATGLSEEQFNAEGYKTMEDLFLECVNFDVFLIRRRGSGQLYRFASSARAEIILPNYGVSLQEVSREFPKSGKPPIVHPKPKRHGCSETIKRNDESALEAMIRAFREEYDVRFRAASFKPIRRNEPPRIGPSSVYPRTMTYNRSWMFAVQLAKPRWWPDGKMVIDGNTRIFNEWRPYQPL